MEITKKVEGNTLELALSGRLDTTTAPELEACIKENLIGDINNMVVDMKDLEYIASAGLRVLLFAQKTVSTNGELVIRNVRPEIMEVLEMTGFTDILKIEKEEA